jgi:hypothetical protein
MEDNNSSELFNQHYTVTLTSKSHEVRKFQKVISLKIIKTINDHVRIYFTGTIDIPDENTNQAEFAAKYLNELNLNEWAIVVKNLMVKQLIQTGTSKQNDENGSVIFLGLVTKAEIVANNGSFDLVMEGASYTYKLDIEKKNRSFQNSAMTYQRLIEKVIGDRAICADLQKQTQLLERLFVQYQITDWEFLKRMSSRQNSGLIADCTESKAKFWFRVPDNSKKEAKILEAVECQVCKNILEYQKIKRNSVSANPKSPKVDGIA